MDLIVDSNIIFSDPMMASPIWQELWADLEKSSGVLLVPEVIKKECISNYLKRCDKLREKIESNTAQLGRLIGREIDVRLPPNDSDAPAYHSRWGQLIEMGKLKLLPNPVDGVFEDLQNRAIERLPPFDLNGNGFRDGTIWLSVRDYVRVHKADTAFISNDRRAYCSKEMEATLHPHLQGEISTSQLYFFTDIPKYLGFRAKNIPVKDFLIDRDKNLTDIEEKLNGELH